MKLKEIPDLLHGGDYNPDQWLDCPDILEEDIRLMKEAGVNVVTLGVFSWTSLEPEEGVFTFSWLDEIMDRLYENGIYVILSTPSGAKPPWLAKKYPETMRMGENRIRLLYGDRENQCNSSVVYREKVRIIDEKLAERYAHHPGLIMWHISNEMHGSCHCELCQENFRKWLKRKYHTIEQLNQQYWSAFWSHRYCGFDEIESPSKHGEQAVHALALDYKRFYSELSIDFLQQEIDAVKKYNPEVPATANMYHHNCGIEYHKLAKILDVISWDSYPRWHCGEDKRSEWKQALQASFDFDFCASLKRKPFYLMESVPSVPSQFAVCKLKRPKMHMLSVVQTIASGADSVQYFQWRKGRGGREKFHGAVLSHNGSNDTRVFRDVCEAGNMLKRLSVLKGKTAHSEAALIFDWENMRALEEQAGLKNSRKDFADIIHEHYEALMKNYVHVDIISQDTDFSSYKLVIAPVLYLFKPETHERIERFTAQGGTFVLTYYSGIVNENDLAYLCFPPYGLNHVFGVKSEEIDSICDDEYNTVTYREKTYQAVDYCDIIHADRAQTLSVYGEDFYAGKPALTKNQYGNGNAYYIAFRSKDDFLYDLYRDILAEAGIKKAADIPYIKDVMIKERGEYLFLMNFSTEEKTLVLSEQTYTLGEYGWKMIRRG